MRMLAPTRCIVVYQTDDELSKFKGRIEPCSTTISTVNRENAQCTGLMYMDYLFCGETRNIPTLLFKSSRSQFIVGINFWHAFGITFAWSDARLKMCASSQGQQQLSTPNVERKKNTDTVSVDPIEIAYEVNAFEKTNNVSGGIFRISSDPHYSRRAKTYLPRWQTNVTKSVSQMRPDIQVKKQSETHITPVYTGYESVEVPLPDHSGNINKQSEIEFPIQVVLALLHDMPRTAHIHEVQVQPAIRTADGASDSVNDIFTGKTVMYFSAALADT